MKKGEFTQCFSLAARIGLALTVGLSVLTAASRVHAQVVQYTDRTSFIAAAAAGLTTFTFDGYTETNGSTQYPHGLTVQGVTFFTTNGSEELWVDDPGDGGGDPFFGHQYLDTDGHSPLSITLPEGATAFGAYFANEGVRNNSTLTATVNGQPFTFAVAGAISGGSIFVGFISHTPITSLVISGGTLGPALDYVSFAPPPQPVHEDWDRRWDGPAHQDDAASKVAVDKDGNVYVAGYSDDASNGTGDDYRLIKYAADGAELWNRHYDGPAHGDDRITGLGLDGAGNVYVTGYSQGSGTYADYATLKYDKDGLLLWVRRYDSAFHGNDFATALAVNAVGDVFVTGYSQQNSGPRNLGTNYVTLKYTTSGRLRWVQGYAGFFSADSVAEAIAVDAAGNSYVTGYSQANGRFDHVKDCITIKYTSSGRPIWERAAMASPNDAGGAIAVDTAGNVYVTGTSLGSFENFGSSFYLTLKYDANGNEVWKRFHAQSQTYASGTALAVDGTGNVLVTGNDGTIKYDPTGDQQWATDNEGGSASALVLDGSGNVYVGGQTSGLNVNFSLIKYGTDGRLHWGRFFDGPSASYDAASALALDADGNVYVTGISDDGITHNDMRTVKYSQ